MMKTLITSCENVRVLYENMYPFVVGFINVNWTSRASVAQLVRARDCQSLGRRFDSV